MITPAQRDKLAQRLNLPRSRDDGSLDPTLAAALARESLPERLEAAVAALATGRVLVPLYPHARPASTAEVEAEAPTQPGEMSVVALDERRHAMEFFSSVAALAAAHPDARPAPLGTRRACLMALAGPARALLDGHLVIPRPAVAALAQGDTWLPAWCDTELVDLVAAELADLDVVGVRLEAGERGRDRVVLALPPAERATQAARIEQASARLAALTRLVVATDTIEIVPVPAP